jgi:hypothetical protein
MRWASGGVGDLLDAGLVKAGDELVWNRRNHGVRHTARIRTDGSLVLADGRVYANPSGATAALGGYNQNGWRMVRRAHVGRAADRTAGAARPVSRVPDPCMVRAGSRCVVSACHRAAGPD